MKGNKSLSQLLIENKFNCELVSKLTRIPLYTVKNTARRIESTHNNSSIPPKDIEVKSFIPLVIELWGRLTFGKYKNKPLSTVIKNDPQYVKWIVSQKLVILGNSVKFNIDLY